MKDIAGYFDYAAATPMDPHVAAAMQPYMTDRFFNPSATYLAAHAVAKDLTAARTKIAHWLGARPSEIIFTAGGTEANNLAIHGVMRQFPDGNAVVSAIEHESVLEPAKEYDHQIAPVHADGIIDVETLHQLINDRTVLVSVMYANNEVGTLQPIKEIARLITQIRKDRIQQSNKLPLYLHTDACQAAAYLDLHTARLGVDMMTINGGKIYGPKQSGALFVRAGITIRPQIVGGGQERGVRSGTENVAQTVGLASALDLVQSRRATESQRLRKIQSEFFSAIKSQLPTAAINGSIKHRLPNNVHITLPGTDNERLIMELDERGIQCAAGSACTADNGEPSHVLLAMSIDEKSAQASLRFTMGTGTTSQAVKTTVNKLAELLHP